ncbi:MAG TPA: endo alpha-1,4 polygalactosaminidase, partial [Polyangiaceae bacterium]
SDYPDERWIDVRDPTVRSIMRERIERAKEVGCDGVHPSGLGGFLADTGLDFERADQLAYNRFLSGVAREQGLSIGLVETDVDLSETLAADFDWSVVWSCLDSDCEAAAPFIALGKAAFLVEYGDASRTSEVCPRARDLGLSAIIKRNADLDAFRAGCP